MAHIMIENLFKKTFEAHDHSKTLLEHFGDQYIDWMQACGRKGRCTTCKVIVKTGTEHFGDLTPAELKYREQGALKANERLACQAKISGDVCVIAPPAYHLPHMRYTDEN